MSGVRIRLVAEHDLTVEECFPDGIPAEWDAETVLAAVQDDGLEAWMLTEYGFDVEVIADDGDRTRATGRCSS